MTIDEMIEFCTEKAKLHQTACDNLENKFGFIEDALSLLKYNAHIELRNTYDAIVHELAKQIEPLTDGEQRLFLAAMERERKVCREVDRSSCREPYEDTLEGKCNAIERKVKAALW